MMKLTKITIEIGNKNSSFLFYLLCSNIHVSNTASMFSVPQNVEIKPFKTKATMKYFRTN
jgi:hypothetical protein